MELGPQQSAAYYSQPEAAVRQGQGDRQKVRGKEIVCSAMFAPAGELDNYQQLEPREPWY